MPLYLPKIYPYAKAGIVLNLRYIQEYFIPSTTLYKSNWKSNFTPNNPAVKPTTTSLPRL